MLISFISPAFAGDAPENIQVTKTSGNSISLDWDDVDEVIGYYIYYGTQTGSGSNYEIEGIDLIDESELILGDLLADTRYYIALTSIDEFGTESEYSSEIEYVTLEQGAVNQVISFRVIDVNVIDETSIELEFSTDLETGISASREFIIEEEGTGKEISVDLSDVLDGQPRKAVVVFATAVSAGTKYKVTVLDISDAGWNTIESWIDAFINFTTPASFAPDLESAGPEVVTPVIETPPVIQEVVPVVEETPVVVESWNNAGTSISTDENTLATAWDNDKLPQAGPEHWILAFIALLLAGGVYYMSSKRES